MSVKTSAFAAFLLLGVLALAAQGNTDLDEASHLLVMDIREAGPPILRADSVIFTASQTARFVGIAFEHESWAVLHPMRRNPHGVFFIVWPVPPLMRETLRYRLMADGAWFADPLNPRRSSDPETGLSLSLVQPPLVSDERPGVFRLVAPDGRTVRFRFKAAPGRVVTVAGSFNSWDPFMYEMEEGEPGSYALDLELPAGEHLYAFVYGGSYRHDELNPDSAWNSSGVRVSRVSVPGGPEDERVAPPEGLSLLP